MLRKIIFVFALYLTFIAQAVVAVDFPALTGPIVDEAGIFSSSQYSYLNGQLKNAPHQVVVVSLRDLRGMEIEDYVVQLARHWGIGQKDLNDGVVVAIAPAQKRIHIAVGYGMEGTITDIQANQIIQNTMLPLARSGEYGEAVVRGTSRVLNLLYKAAQISAHKEEYEEIDNPFDDPISSTEMPSVIQEMLGWIGYFFWGAVIWSFIKRFLYKINSCINRSLFVTDIIICHVVCAVLIYFSIIYAIAFFALIVGVFLIFADYRYYRLWRLNPKFPCQPSAQLQTGGSGCHVSGRSGNNSFRGGGGSFGGGGASGRW